MIIKLNLYSEFILTQFIIEFIFFMNMNAILFKHHAYKINIIIEDHTLKDDA